VDLEDGVGGVMLSREQRFQLGALRESVETVNGRLQLFGHILALLGELEEGLRLLQQGIEAVGGGDALLQARAPALELLYLVLVAPDLRLRETLLQLGQLLLLAGDIKDTPATLPPFRLKRRFARRSPDGRCWARRYLHSAGCGGIQDIGQNSIQRVQSTVVTQAPL
jgi:hypothetical protein